MSPEAPSRLGICGLCGGALLGGCTARGGSQLQMGALHGWILQPTR